MIRNFPITLGIDNEAGKAYLMLGSDPQPAAETDIIPGQTTYGTALWALLYAPALGTSRVIPA